MYNNVINVKELSLLTVMYHAIRNSRAPGFVYRADDVKRLHVQIVTKDEALSSRRLVAHRALGVMDLT